MAPKYWLMKAEPDSRIVKGKDVKFSADDFETVETTPWEGVRNAEARNLMKEMKIGDKVLFYHSNCKNPGIAAFAEVSKEAYPDYTAWDSTHPYYDAKTDQEKPKWYMVDVTFVARAVHFVPLALLRRIAAVSAPPSDVEYIGIEGLKAVKEMALVSRGRLSVQRVEANTWAVIEMLAEKGGWEDNESGSGKAKRKKGTGAEKKIKAMKKGKRKGAKRDDEDNGEDRQELEDPEVVAGGNAEPEKNESREKAAGRKRKATDIEEKNDIESASLRRSTRARK